MFDQAADSIRREIGLHQQNESYGPIGRLAVALVLVQLARDDYVAAEKAFKEWGNCCDAHEGNSVQFLISVVYLHNILNSCDIGVAFASL